MKKFFNDHLAIFFIVALIVAAVALYFSLKTAKDAKAAVKLIADAQREALGTEANADTTPAGGDVA